MNTIKITVGNSYMQNMVEEFYCVDIDISDLPEVEYCVEECIGQYIEMHQDIIHSLDIDSDNLYEKIYYSIEEVIEDDL